VSIPIARTRGVSNVEAIVARLEFLAMESPHCALEMHVIE
jgi:hypothetical protein